MGEGTARAAARVIGVSPVLVWLLGVLTSPACGDTFTEGGSGGGGTAATTTTTTTGNAGGASAGSSTTSTPGGGGGTGGADCPHGVCDPGEPLAAACDPCIATLCESTPDCCASSWTLTCVYAALHACDEDCSEASCEDQYGTPGSNLAYCSHTATECEMEVSGASNCFTFCRQNGGECLRAYDATADECTHGQSQPCMNATGSGAAVCVCSRGCGTTPPCASGEYCDGGNCLQLRSRQRGRAGAGSPHGS